MSYCRLCQKDRVLRNSHIIPEFLYGELYNNKHQIMGIHGRGPKGCEVKMGRVKAMLATTCQATVPEKGYSEELEQGLVIQYLIYYRSRYTRLTVQLEELQITIPAKGQAVVQVTARLQRHLPGQVDAPMESHRVELSLLKGDQCWLIEKAILPASLINENTLP